MNLKFVINESVLIWYLLFHQSISKEMNDYKQKVWKNYCSEYKDLQKEKEIILRDPKNYIPDDDTIYDIMREFDGYDDIYMDDDYDYDRYYKDSDYADGVDDAMDDLDEDW